MGSEPIVQTYETQGELSSSLNWYNYNYTPKDVIPWVTEYMKEHNYSSKDIAIIKSLPEWKIGLTTGALCRIVNIGGILPAGTIERINDRLNTNINNVIITKDIKETLVTRIKTNDKIGSLISDFEDEIDSFIENNFETTFKPYDYMKRREVKSSQANAIIKYYNRLHLELSDLILGNNSQLKEGYNHLSKTNIKKFYVFITQIISDAESIATVTKAIKKTRVSKEKSAVQLISKIRYLKESAPYKIASIDPTKIIKAKTLFVFNTKTRKLGMYVAADDNGLSVKISTITNFDEEKSVSKTLRKPELILNDLLNNSRMNVIKSFNAISTSNSKMNGRINEETILLRVL